MFVENFKLDTMIVGQAQPGIPYPKMSEAEWEMWKAFLPVKSVPFCKEMFVCKEKSFLHITYGIPLDVCHEMLRGANYFEEIEIWRKREVRKHSLAVGIAKNRERHLICRWGMVKPIPFDRIKSFSWFYQIQNFGVMLLTSEKFRSMMRQPRFSPWLALERQKRDKNGSRPRPNYWRDRNIVNDS